MGNSPVITADVYSIMPDFPVITANLYSITAGAYSKPSMSTGILGKVPVITVGVPVITAKSGGIMARGITIFLCYYIFRKYFVFL
jgi:hypothetical protein